MFDKKIKLTPSNIETINQIPNGLMKEIEVIDVLETDDNQNILENICSKLRVNGILKLSGIDCLDVCRRVYYGEIELKAASNIFKNMNNVNSIASLKKHFLDLGWEVIFAGLNNGRYLVEVKKNDNRAKN